MARVDRDYMAGSWSEREIGAIVEDYFEMLEDELHDRPYNKSSHRRVLREKIDRSKGSIERKHMNISAVLHSLGLPYIDGYKPFANYQNALFEAVEAHLKENRDLHGVLAGENVAADQSLPGWTGASVPLLEYAPPPPMSPPERVPKDIRQIIRRFEPPAARDARNRRLGTAGEALVYSVERERLLRLGKTDLAERVRWVARDDGDECGFDILSFVGTGDRPCEERWLEVKTTTGPKATPFFITRNELNVSREYAGVFRVVRLYDFQRLKRAYRLRPPLENRVNLSAAVYTASF